MLEPVLLIEVDDSTHETPLPAKAGTILWTASTGKIGLPILHVWGPEELEEAVAETWARAAKAITERTG